MFNWLIFPTIKRNHGTFKRQPASRASRPSPIFQLEELEGRLTPTVIPFYIDNNTQENKANSGLADNQIYVFFEAKTDKLEGVVPKPFSIDHLTGAATITNGEKVPDTQLIDLPTEKLLNVTYSKITIDTSTYPNLYGGRLYFSNFKTAVTADGGGNAQNPKAKQNFYYDYVEFALNTDPETKNIKLTVDTTQVDQVGMPITLQLSPEDPLNPTGSGTIATLDRQTMFANYQKAMATDVKFAGYQGLLISNGDEGYYQILSPQNLIDSQLTFNSDGKGNGIQMNANIALGTRTSENWTTVVTLIGNNNLQFKNGMQVEGPYIPAGSIVSGIPEPNPGPGGSTFTLTSALPDNPFPGATNVPLMVYTAPTTTLNSWFGPAVGQPANLNSGNSIDDFFAYWKSNPNPLLVENTSEPNRRSKTVSVNPDSASFVYTGNVTTVTAPNINGIYLPATLTTSGAEGNWSASLSIGTGLGQGNYVSGPGLPSNSTIFSITASGMTVTSNAANNPFSNEPTAQKYNFGTDDGLALEATLAWTGSAANWVATLTLTTPPNTTTGLNVGDEIVGPGIPAGSIISLIPDLLTVNITNTSTGGNPFAAQPDTQNYGFFSGKNLSTYTVLQFTNSETKEVYNIYYPYFTSNSPPGKTDPFGNNVPPPPQWWALKAPRLSPSQMVFAANTVFADNGIRTYPKESKEGNPQTLGSLENTIATALARGLGTTWQFGNNATYNPPSTNNQQASWTLPKGAYDPIKDKISVGMNVTSWAINGVPMTISAIAVDSNGDATITVKTTGTFPPGVFTDLLTFFSPYESGQTWSAYSAFMHNMVAKSPGGTDFYQNFINGNAYALPFDDNGGFSSTIASTVNDSQAIATTITLSPWTPTCSTCQGLISERKGSEIVVGSGQGSLPEVKIYDQNGAIVSSFLAYDPGFLGGVEVASGDLTRDGFPEIITGAGHGGGPHIKIYDGKTGLLMRGFFAFDPGFTGGVSVATGDLNNDGFGDIIVGAGAGGGPRVCVFDGKTGAMIRSFFAYDSKFTGGVRVASGDTNQDSYSDIITGAGFGGGPNVKVFSGLDNTLLRSFFAYDSNLRNGVFVSAGDLDGDSYSEIFTGTGYGSSPQVKVFNPQTLAVVHDFYAYDLGFTGGVRVAAKDFNLDGQLDIITGSGKSGGPNVKAFDGNTLAVLDSFFAFPETFRGGVFVG